MAVTDKVQTNKLNIRAAAYSVTVSSVLFTIKIIIGVSTNSMAIIASALDSAFDFISSSVNFFAIRHAQKPADHQHRFGHGKAEALAGFLQSIFIFSSGVYLIYKSLQRFFAPAEIINIDTGIYVMFISIALTFGLVSYQHWVQKKSKSMVIAADRLHYVSDLLSNLAVIISLLLGKFFSFYQLDVVAALGIAIFIIKGSFNIFKQSFDILMDRDISDKYREDIKTIIESQSSDIIGYHDLRSRSAGDIDFLELHLELPSHLKVIDSHDIIEDIMFKLKKIHPNVEIIIHTDPAEVDADSGKIKLFDREKPRFY
ncbi:MAG: cation diffusion facilitator family transporter [Spirochaetia bacterium]|nr:cation diffusion facilitator family transporter [Spirochaetia bacterium]